jgi:hypothetical protein
MCGALDTTYRTNYGELRLNVADPDPWEPSIEPATPDFVSSAAPIFVSPNSFVSPPLRAEAHL